MAEIEHVKRTRVGKPNCLTSSATKREKSENDAKCKRSRINIGEEFGRWTDLKIRWTESTRRGGDDFTSQVGLLQKVIFSQDMLIYYSTAGETVIIVFLNVVVHKKRLFSIETIAKKYF